MSPDGRPVHQIDLAYPVIDDCLQIGGKPLTRLAQQVGSTPFYAYDRNLLSDRVQALRAHLPTGVDLHYAIKANPMPAVVQHMAMLVDGLDVASAREMQTALDTGMSPTSISLAGPGKTESELSRAIAAGIIINIESEAEMESISRLGGKFGLRPPVAVRVNPDFELKTSGMKMSGGPKQFGVDAERVPAMLKRFDALNLDFMGFHIFSGSQNLRIEAIQEAQQNAVQLAIELAQYAPGPVRLLNIGGGLGIPYFPGDKPITLAPIGENLSRLLPRIHEHMPEAQVVLEFGRYLVGEAGVYVCRVVDRKISRGQVFLITDGGLHHHLAASGNFGQVVRKNYPVLIGNKVKGTRREVVSVVGPLCTPLDLLADRMEMAEAEVGDLVVIFQSGAYGASASPVNFLSHPVPAEVLV
jgi:diaminopimelate decarboxylase